MTDNNCELVKTAYCVKCKSKQELKNENFIEKNETSKVARITGNCIICN